jgi:hypothetical protein
MGGTEETREAPWPCRHRHGAWNGNRPGRRRPPFSPRLTAGTTQRRKQASFTAKMGLSMPSPTPPRAATSRGERPIPCLTSVVVSPCGVRIEFLVGYYIVVSSPHGGGGGRSSVRFRMRRTSRARELPGVTPFLTSPRTRNRTWRIVSNAVHGATLEGDGRAEWCSF